MHVRMCVCVCMSVRLSLVHQPTFQVDESLSGESWVPAQLLAGGSAQLTPPSLRKPPFHCCSWATRLSVPPAPCTGPADFNYTLSAEFTGGFPGRRRHLSPDPQLLISSVDQQGHDETEACAFSFLYTTWCQRLTFHPWRFGGLRPLSSPALVTNPPLSLAVM